MKGRRHPGPTGRTEAALPNPDRCPSPATADTARQGCRSRAALPNLKLRCSSAANQLSVKQDSIVPRSKRRSDSLPAADLTRLHSILDRWQATPGALLPILHDVQAAFGYVPPGAVGPIAKALNQSRAEVHGVISFYHDFRQSPPGRSILKVCQAESCQACGSRELTAHIEARLGCKLGERSPDGAFTLEAVYCLGNCACSPAVLLDGELHGRMTPAKADRLLDAARQGS